MNKMKRLLLFGAVLFVIILYPVASHAATSTNPHSGHNMDMSEPAGTATGNSMPGHTMDTTADTKPAGDIPVHTMDEMPAAETSNMPGHNMDTSAESTPTGGAPAHNMDEMPATEMPNMPGHNMEAAVDSEPASDSPDVSADAAGHGGHAGNSSGTGSVSKEVNRAGLLGGFAFLNGLVVLSAAVLKRKKSPAAGVGINES